MAMNDEGGAEEDDETEDDEDEDYADDGETTQYSPFFGNAAAAPAAPRHTETSFDGISTRAFPRKVADRLVAPVDPNIVEIKPDGTVYLPEIMYRRILNSAFGPGGWALMPRGPATHGDKFLTREWALFCHGRFVAQASGESEMLTSFTGPATALEGVKSQALVRCCKDLGVASELWDMAYVTDWKNKYAVAVWCENQKTGQKKTLYRRLDRPPFPYPWKESQLTTSTAASSPSSSSSSSPAPKTSTSAATSSSSATSAGAAKAAYSTAAEPFDMEALLPRELKKFAGKRWSEVVSTDEGQKYLDYIANNFEGAARGLAQRALDSHHASRK